MSIILKPDTIRVTLLSNQRKRKKNMCYTVKFFFPKKSIHKDPKTVSVSSSGCHGDL